MIPRALLFGNPDRTAFAISPDGRWLSWAAAGERGLMNLWVAPIDDRAAARQVTFDERRGVVGHFWAFDSRTILFSQDFDGAENHQVFAVDATTGVSRCLTPHAGSRSMVMALSQDHRSKALVGMANRDPRHLDLHLLDLDSGELSLMMENPGLQGFVFDQDLQPRFARRPDADGGAEILRRGESGDWTIWDRFDAETARTSGLSHLDRSGRFLHLFDARDRDIAALVEVDLADRDRRRVLAESDLAEIGGVIGDPVTWRPVAYAVTHERMRRHLINECFRDELAFLDGQGWQNWGVAGQSEDGDTWLIGASSDRDPGAIHLYDRTARRVVKLVDLRPELADLPLARMQSLTIPARDSLPLVCYLSLPVAVDGGATLTALAPPPMVVVVHGGPWARDHFGYSTMHQWLCDRGYAVLNVNFRGSTGFGKRFLVAGDGEWGRRMGDDIEDAVDWVIARGLANPEKLGIMGSSYGGFAVLSALTRFPGRYACGIDIVGPADLETLLAATPPRWESERQMLYRAIGDPDTDEGRVMLRARSPIHAADAIRDPLLIAQGANDTRVPRGESDAMVAALRRHGIPVTYALFPDEGHGVTREPNRLDLNAAIERFLAANLDGIHEPRPNGGYVGSSMQLIQA